MTKYLLFIPIALILACGTSKQTKEPVAFPEPNIPTIIELINATDSLLDQLGNSQQELYTWKNHTAIFGAITNPDSVVNSIQQLDSSVQIKVYQQPRYLFDYQQHCHKSYLGDHWNNYLLTANLVEDTVLQQEYIDYHDRQFEEWPEVAQGFCNADFQQLLVYRNGRQLMLVISVPEDKTLDELNPKTTANNPRMDEWNSIMGKYQEGVEGTEEGEVWVFLESKTL